MNVATLAAAVSIVTVLVGGTAGAITYFAPKQDVMVVQLQVQDLYDERIKGIVRRITEIELIDRRRQLTASEARELADLKAEEARLRRLRYGK